MCVGAHGFIPVLGVMRVQLIYTCYSQRIENVFHVISGGGLLAADMDRVEGVFATWWTTPGRAQVPNNISLVLVVVDALNVESGLHKEYTSGWTAAGGLGVASLPAQNSVTVKLSTTFAGRSFRGRIFWPGLTPNDVAAGLVSTSRRDTIVAAVNTLRTSLAAGGDTLAVVSYCHDGAWRASGVATPVTSASAKTTVTQQKRRRVAGA